MDGAVSHIADDAPPDAIAEAVDHSASCESGDARLRRAFERCGDDLYRFIVLRVRGDRHAADDLIQQTCYEAARHRRIPSGDDDAGAWLFGIARNLIRKHFRSLRRQGRLRSEEAVGARPSLFDAEDCGADAVAQADLAQHLMAAIAALNEADQQLILGSYFEGRSQEELAKAIGISVRAIEGRLYRARNALRESLTAQLGEDQS